ncbi:MAG: DapH/DapD/GlmU-related protein [Alphaproteobacteria bacterium]|nr:DapH/DapD/GlmU-related protein [Alphaproteobacteria bacterium]
MALSGGKNLPRKKKVIIGDCTYIGAQTVIKGVSIGKHCVIGANSFINKNVEDYSIVEGSPAEKIGKVLVDGDNIKLEYAKDNF